MPFNQNYSAPDPLKSLLPFGEGLHDSYQKLVFICSLVDVEDESDSKKLLISYVSTNWTKIVNDIKAAHHSRDVGGCKRYCLPCKAHCWTSCKSCEKDPFPHYGDIDCVNPVGGGISSEILELISTSKEAAGIISRKRFELGKTNALAMQKKFKSLNIPKDQGVPLIETTIFSFAKGAIEHKEKDGWDVLKFTPDNFFASYSENYMKFNEIMSIELCTAAPWFAGYCEVIANVKVEYSFPKKQGEPFSIKLKQM